MWVDRFDARASQRARGYVRSRSRVRAQGEAGEAVPGLYCTGWIKRGPSGVIGTNKKDASETVTLLLEDAAAGLLRREDDADVADLLAERGVEHVSHAGWQAIDEHERGRGEAQGRPRIKLGRWDELLEAGKTSPS